MRSGTSDTLPPRIRRSLAALGVNLAIARRRRRLTVAMVAERMGVSRATYLRLEKGDPSVAMGSWAMALFVLGFDDAFALVADPAHDDTGVLLETERLPRRVRPPRRAPP